MAPNNKDEEEEGAIAPSTGLDSESAGDDEAAGEESADDGVAAGDEDADDEDIAVDEEDEDEGVAADQSPVKQLEILDEPEGLPSIIEPIAPEDAPDAFVQEEADEDMEELDEIEELDDFELVEEDEPAPVAAAPRPPPPLPRPPPSPKAKAPPPAPEPESQADAQSEDADESEVEEAAVKGTRAPSEAPAIPPESPPALADEVPAVLLEPDPVSVLDSFLEGRESLDWAKRAAQLTRELDQAEGKARIGELAYELGELYMRQLDNEAAAVKAYGRALQADPSLRANLWAIRKIFYRRELWPNLVKLVGAELRFASNEAQRVDLLTERGRILLHHIGDLAAAQESYEQALALDGSDIQSLMALERIARAAGQKPILWRALEGLARAVANPDRKAALLIELAREYRLSKDRYDEAKQLLGEATELGVLHDALAREREALAVATEDGSAFAASLERRVSVLAESFGDAGIPAPADVEQVAGAESRLRTMVALRRHQAQVLSQSDDSEGAWSCLQEALNLSPNDALVLVDLADMAESLGRYEELAELVEAREQGEVDPTKALGLALRRASALAKAGKADEADELISARAVANPGYLPLVTARELHSGKQKDWRRLAALQKELADALRLGTSFGPGADTEPAPQSAAAHYVVAGDLLRYGVADSEAAAAHYQLALTADPGFAAAREALVSLLIADREFSRAAVVLQEQSQSDDPQVARRALERLVSVQLFLDRRTDELVAHRRLLALAPDNPSYQDRLLELLREQCLYLDLAKELKARAKAATDAEMSARFSFEAGRIFLDRLENPTEASCALEICHRAWPDDAIVLDCLLDAYRRSKDWKALLNFLKEQGESGGDAVSAAARGREALAILEFQLKDQEAASKLAFELAGRHPENLPLLLDALSCVDRGQAEPSEMVELLAAVAAASEGWLRAQTLLRLGSLQAELGQAGEAEGSFEEATSLGSLAGIFMLHSMSAKQGLAAGTTEALTSLARHAQSISNKTSLLEQAGWRSVVSLDDEGASALFAECMELQNNHAGATLGASLLAAKSGDRALQGECLASLASVSGSSYARSSLLMRAGQLADVLGDDKVARQRIEESWAIAPEDAGSAIMAADRLPAMSFDAPSGVEGLLSRAELCGVRAALADAGPGRVDWVMERADALEAAGKLQEAGQAAALILDEYPDDIRALQTLRRICQRGGDRKNLAHCSLSLASQLGDDAGRLQYLREAVEIFDGELGDDSSAVVAYRMILELEPGAPEYDRMIEILVQHDDVGSLYRCYTARLNHLDVLGDQNARTEILLARARLRAGIGDIRGASRDLKALLVVEPVHQDALLDRARLLERTGEAKSAAEHYQIFLAVSADSERRSSAELSLSYLMVESLDDLHGAIEQLKEVVAESPDDIELRERLVTLFLQAKRIDEAIELIRDMGQMRQSEGERARDELRIAAVQRDASRIDDAIESLEKGRRHDPLNMDVMRDLIELCGAEEEKHESLLAAILRDVRAEVLKQPLRGGLYQRLVTIAQWSEDASLHRQALEALSFAASLSAEQVQQLETLPGAGTRLSRELKAGEWTIASRPLVDHAFADEVWKIIGPAVAEVSGATPAGLGFERGQRTKGKAVAKSYPAIAEMLQHAGLLESEVYVSETSASVARSTSAEVATLLLGTGIVRASTDAQRFALGRAIAHARFNTGTAAGLDAAKLCLYFAAAANVAGVDKLRGTWTQRVDAEALSDVAKSLGKALGRKGRKDLSVLAERFTELGDPVLWQQATQASAANIGLLFCGSLAAAFDVLDVGPGGRPLDSDPVAQALMAWSVSPDYLKLRKELGPQEVKNG